MCKISHSTDWDTTFRNRLHTLPLEYEILNAELCEVSRAYEVFCTDLKERLESLRHKRTATAAALPAEVLLLIFSQIAQDEPLGDMWGCRGELADYESTDDGEGTDDDESTNDDEDSNGRCPAHPAHRDCRMIPGLGWSRVSHVCSHWRAVATENGTLWTTISMNLCTPWLKEVTLRSRSLPLDIVMPCDSNWEAVNEVLPGCLARVRSIDAERVTDDVQVLLSTRSTPLLEYLDIDHHMIISDTMGASLPRLKHLSLTSAYSLPNLHGLADFQITHLALLSVVTLPSPKQLRDLFQFLKGVNHLHLENCLPLGSEDISPQPIVLSRLKTLILRGQTSSCGALMRSITYPSSTSTALYMTPDEPQVTNIPEYMHRSGLDVLLDNTASTVFHSLYVSCLEIRPHAWQLVVAGQCDPCQISDSICDDIRAETEWTGPSFQDLKIVCMLDGDEPPHALALGLFTHIMAKLPLSSLSMLSLNVDALLRLDADSWNHTRWLSVLKDADKVEHLRLISSSWRVSDTNKHAQPSPYVDLLVTLSIGRTYAVSPHAVMPELEYISLINIDAAATALLKGNGTWLKDLRVSAAQALRFFVRARPSFDESHIQVLYDGMAWRDSYFKPSIEHATGPLEDMSWELKKENVRIEEHSMIKHRVLWSKRFAPENTE